MKKAGYWVFYVWISVLSLMPLSLLLGISTLLYFIIYYLLGYRKKVVRDNLYQSFPDKSAKELLTIEKKYYRHLCDLLVEGLWATRASAKQIQKHCRFVNLEQVEKWYAQKQDFIFLLGHAGNWEWNSLSFSTYGLHQPWALYRPIKNKDFDRFFYAFRTRLGARLIPMQQVIRAMNEPATNPFVLAFIADQSPVPEYAYWTDFLHRDTGFFNGYDKIARKKDLPVMFAYSTKIKRGYYEVRLELLSEHPASLKENELTELFARHLEKQIIDAPEYWLWSHKRWKRKRPDGM